MSSNHPNRGQKGPASNPTPEAVKAAREAAGLTQDNAAKLIHRSRSQWIRWENGESRMPPDSFQYFRIVTGQHPTINGKVQQALLDALMGMMDYAAIIEERCDDVATNKARDAIALAVDLR